VQVSARVRAEGEDSEGSRKSNGKREKQKVEGEEREAASREMRRSERLPAKQIFFPFFLAKKSN